MGAVDTVGDRGRAHRLVAAGFVVLAGLLLAAGCASGDADARSIEGKVWSPYCPGRLLTDCPTQQSRELKEQIAARVDAGESEAEVLAWVRDEFGDEAIARPETSGSGLVIWLVPALIFLVGALVVWRFVSRNVERTSATKEGTHADP